MAFIDDAGLPLAVTAPPLPRTTTGAATGATAQIDTSDALDRWLINHPAPVEPPTLTPVVPPQIPFNPEDPDVGRGGQGPSDALPLEPGVTPIEPTEPDDYPPGEDPDEIDESDTGLTVFAAEADKPGTVIGRPWQGSHSKATNCAPSPGHPNGPSCNWQSMNAYDIAMPSGTRILAVEDGTISPDGWGYGDTGMGGRFTGKRLHLVTTRYGPVFYYTHLLQLVAKKGVKVKKGDVIGVSGALNHLHFAVGPSVVFDPWKWAYLTSQYGAIGSGNAPPVPPGVEPIKPVDTPDITPTVLGPIGAWQELMHGLAVIGPRAGRYATATGLSLASIFQGKDVTVYADALGTDSELEGLEV